MRATTLVRVLLFFVFIRACKLTSWVQKKPSLPSVFVSLYRLLQKVNFSVHIIPVSVWI